MGFLFYLVFLLFMFVCLILLLPQTLALTASIAIAMAHTAGASTWLLFRFNYGYQACCGLFFFTAFALAVGIRKGWRAEPREDAPLGARWPSLARWGVIVAIFAITTYLFLWPRKA